MDESRRPFPLALVLALRPRHWVKNVFVFAALVFAGRMADPVAVGRAGLAFAVFCALSSAVYLVNDLRDREADRRHPAKRHRPIARGDLSPQIAAAVSVLLAVSALLGAIALSPALGKVAGAYFAINLAYSFGLKRVVILDVMLVSSGFLLRAWAGAVVVGVEISHWLVLCTGLLALFLGFVKRRQELEGIADATTSRAILKEYSLPFLDQMIAVVTGAIVVAYSLYAFSPEVAERLGTTHLGLTIPFVLFGIFRYLFLVHQRGEGENPTAVVFSDGPLVADVVLWAAAVVVALYFWR